MKHITLLILSFLVSNIAVAEANSSIYNIEYFLSNSHEPFHAEHLTKVSICEDETMAQCQEVVSDKYGYLTHDLASTKVDLSPLNAAFHTYELSEELDDVVKNSIHQSDRIFAHVG